MQTYKLIKKVSVFANVFLIRSVYIVYKFKIIRMPATEAVVVVKFIKFVDV